MKSIFTVITLLSITLLTKHVHAAEYEEIVSAGGSITEILFALEQQHKIAAVDTSSLYPIAAQQMPKVGYYRQLSPEGILSTGAKKLFTHGGAGPVSGLEQLKDAGLEVVVFENPKTLQGLKNLIADISEKTNSQYNAEKLIAELNQQITQIKTENSNLAGKKVAFLMSANQQGLMAAGQDTVPNLIFNELGLVNIFSDFNGYKQVSSEALITGSPELILLPQHQSSGQNALQICNTQALKVYTLTQGCNLHIVDSLMFLGMTPRLPNAMQLVTEKLASK